MTLKEIIKRMCDAVDNNDCTWVCFTEPEPDAPESKFREFIRRIIDAIENNEACMRIGDIPDEEIDKIARAILPEIAAYFQTEEGRAEFEKWMAEQKKKSDLQSEIKKKSEVA